MRQHTSPIAPVTTSLFRWKSFFKVKLPTFRVCDMRAIQQWQVTLPFLSNLFLFWESSWGYLPNCRYFYPAVSFFCRNTFWLQKVKYSRINPERQERVEFRSQTTQYSDAVRGQVGSLYRTVGGNIPATEEFSYSFVGNIDVNDGRCRPQYGEFTRVWNYGLPESDVDIQE